MIPCAVARNMQTMLVARFLDGLAGSAFLSVAGGTVGDLFAKHVSLPANPRLAAVYSNANIGAISADDGVHSKSIRWPRSRTSDRRGRSGLVSQL